MDQSTSENASWRSLAWIHRLKKKDLAEILREQGLDDDGIVVDMRKRLIEYFSKPQPTVSAPAIVTAYQPDKEEIAALDYLRKWDVRFEGGKDAVDFLERVEELRAMLDITSRTLLRALPIILKGKALLWARNCQDGWDTWSAFVAEFKQMYFPVDYTNRMREEATQRQQRKGELFSDFATDLRTRLRRLGISEMKQIVQRIYDNSLPEYRLYIKRRDFSSLNELFELAQEYEALRRTEMKAEVQPTPARSRTAGSSQPPARYDHQSYGWNSGQTRHVRFEGRRPERKICYLCGREGVVARECTCQGNTRGAGQRQGELSPRYAPLSQSQTSRQVPQ